MDFSLFKYAFIVFTIAFTSLNISAQNDSLTKYAKFLDSINLRIDDVIVTGNKVTRREVIVREMKLKQGSKLTFERYQDDYRKIYNLGLFNRVELIPLPKEGNKIILNVDVNERWYILPLPDAGMEDGEWKKLWFSLKIVWDNMRGMNESMSAGFRIFYNPWVKFSYNIPWIGNKLRLFASVETQWSRNRNKSLELSGSTSNEISFENQGYDNFIYELKFRIGKKLSERLSVFTDYRFNQLKVNEYRPGRTMSPSGTDKWLTLGAGITYDSRNFYDYSTKGLYVQSYYNRYGLISEEIDFGRLVYELRTYMPLHLNENYFLTIASRFHNSLAVGSSIPAYSREVLGYSDNFVRGWSKFAFEGDNSLTVYNELRIPVIHPRNLRGKELPLIRDIIIARDLEYRYGLYLTLIYDVGAVWFKNENIFKKKFLQGTGIGLNFLLPFGHVFRVEWAFRLSKPVVGDLELSLRAKL